MTIKEFFAMAFVYAKKYTVRHGDIDRVFITQTDLISECGEYIISADHTYFPVLILDNEVTIYADII